MTITQWSDGEVSTQLASNAQRVTVDATNDSLPDRLCARLVLQVAAAAAANEVTNNAITARDLLPVIVV